MTPQPLHRYAITIAEFDKPGTHDIVVHAPTAEDAWFIAQKNGVAYNGLSSYTNSQPIAIKALGPQDPTP